MKETKEKKKLDIIYKKLEEIMPYEKNPRNNEKAIEPVANSIKQFGFKQPIVIDAAGVIIVGHTRYEAARYLGLKEVPCAIADDLSPYEVQAYRLADNKVAEFSEWDFNTLDSELFKLDDYIDMAEFGFEVNPNEIPLEKPEEFEEFDEEIETKNQCPKCGYEW